ncbi:hypothetical protein BDFB_014935 [Asbolus verrucosus]|uniref:Uncharacterized protein n=1 Tax=Asbolus verrucosus TaxID=1661398 RepID=A0A482VH84_ASBVE|nr:hypothetical protein BDFB_014935 [Asbolus verrucosus]
MVRAYKPPKLNFNLIVLAILVHVSCPTDNGNIIEIAARQEAAIKLFTRQCPMGARVVEVTAIRGRGRKIALGVFVTSGTQLPNL